MNDNFIYLCEFDEKLIDSFSDNNFVIIANTIKDIKKIIAFINQKNHLISIIIKEQIDSMSSFPYHELPNDVRFEIHFDYFGDFKEFSTKIGLIRELNINLYLSPKFENNFTFLQILSSLNIKCGLSEFEEIHHWDKTIDLLYYSTYSKIPHTTIEPFGFILSNYRNEGLLDILSYFYNDPTKYIYLDSIFNIYLNKRDFLLNNHIGNGKDFLINIKNNTTYKENLKSWQNHFVYLDECSSCKSFRICKGLFKDENNKVNTCKKLFDEIFKAIDFSNKHELN